MTAAKPKAGSNPAAHPRIFENERFILGHDDLWLWRPSVLLGWVVIETCECESFRQQIARDQYAEWIDYANRASDLIMRRTRQWKKKPLNDWLYDALDSIEIDAIGIAQQWRAWERER
jgi:hypothetical protein